jgi:hypothetical protein
VKDESRAVRGGWLIAGGGGEDSMLRFWLESGGNRTKRCQKMKRSYRAHLGSMRRKCDTTQRHGNVDRRRGGTGKGKGRTRC